MNCYSPDAQHESLPEIADQSQQHFGGKLALGQELCEGQGNLYVRYENRKINIRYKEAKVH